MEKEALRFRCIYEPEAGPERYAAHDFALIELMNEGKLPPTLLVKGWKRPFVTIGYYSDVDDDINVEKCMELGWSIDRRKTGGGFAYYDSSTMRFTLASSSDFFTSLEQAFYDFVDDLEQRLMGVSALNREEILGIVEDLFNRPDFECTGIAPNEFAKPILEACGEVTEAG